MIRALFVATFVALTSPARAQAPEPDAYRTENYRAAVPATLKGATVLSTPEARALWQAKTAVFIDVLPQPPRPNNLPKDVVWRDKPRFDIPGSVWLPDTGFGELAKPTLDYFLDGVRRAEDSAHTLVFYCQRQCWMSWNAARRALALGFSKVAWYPDGADGWSEAGLPLEARTPEPRPQ